MNVVKVTSTEHPKTDPAPPDIEPLVPTPPDPWPELPPTDPFPPAPDPLPEPRPTPFPEPPPSMPQMKCLRENVTALADENFEPWMT